MVGGDVFLPFILNLVLEVIQKVTLNLVLPYCAKKHSIKFALLNMLECTVR